MAFVDAWRMEFGVRALLFFFFNDTATTEIYTLSLHDALPIFIDASWYVTMRTPVTRGRRARPKTRSEEHTSELQSQSNLVCRLLLEKKKIPDRSNNLPIDQVYETQNDSRARPYYSTTHSATLT